MASSFTAAAASASKPPPVTSCYTPNAVRNMLRGTEMALNNEKNGPLIIAFVVTGIKGSFDHHNNIPLEIEGTFYDDSEVCHQVKVNHQCMSVIPVSARPLLVIGSRWNVWIKGYVTSRGNNRGCEPFLNVTDMEFLAHSRHEANGAKNRSIEMSGKFINEKNDNKDIKNNKNNRNLKPWHFCSNDALKCFRVRGGGFPDYLINYAPYLSESGLSGLQYEDNSIDNNGSTNNGFVENSSTLSMTGTDTALLNNEENYKTVQDFLAHHNAMKLLQHTAVHAPGLTGSGTNENNPVQAGQSTDALHVDTSDAAAGADATTAAASLTTTLATDSTATQHITNYFSALREFASSQLDRQKASLAKHAARDTNQATIIATKHRDALDLALQSESPPSYSPSFSRPLPSPSSSSTATLTPFFLRQLHGIVCDQLHPEAGEYRTKNVKAGLSTFCPYQDVPANVEIFCKAIRSLEKRLQLFQLEQHGGFNSAISVMTYAAAVFFGIVDIHPFADGNGRLARVLSNWAFRRAGLPFVINWFATAQQRRECVTAILMVTRNTLLVSRGNVTEDVFISCLSNVGGLAPLVNLLMDRVSKAIQEFTKLVKEKSVAAIDEGEAKAARLFRERAALGNCIICLEEKPNIATLCCGKAVHLNCIAEWLGNHSTCPQCRGQMPTLQTSHQTTSNESLPASFFGTPFSLLGTDSDSDDDEDDTSDFSLGTFDDTTSADETSTTDEQQGNGQQQRPLDEDNNAMDIESDDTASNAISEDVNSNDNNSDAESADHDGDDDEESDSDDDNTETESSHDANDDTYSTASTTTSSSTMFTSHINDVGASTSSNNNRGQWDPQSICCYDNCRNRLAQDCANDFCGRCCIRYGQYACQRHSCA